MGLGHFGGGAAAARWLAEQGARVTLTDLATADELARTLHALGDVTPAAVHLGGHREDDFRSAEMIVVNPAVRPDNPMLKIARRRGARLATEIELFMEACPARIIGVTGSNGKSTTAAMIAAVLRADGRAGWLGGNIGASLLADLEKIAPDDFVVLELSSFQLARLGPNVAMPHVAVVTNFTPNHLNWHGTLERYRAAKRRLIAEQSSQGLVALDASLLESGGCMDCSWADSVSGRLLPPVDVAELPLLRTPGDHNRRNAVLAVAVARAVGCSADAIHDGLKTFETLPGRLQQVATIGGRFFYNDTTSTTPESTIAAVCSLDTGGSLDVERALDNGQGGTWLLAGGSDKGVDFGTLAVSIIGHTRGAAFFGATTERLRRETAMVSENFQTAALKTLRQALDWCWRHSSRGDRIILSPGCASLDQFRNFRDRGDKFIKLVNELERTARH